MFQKSSNPNSPLFETRSQFVDQSKFFGSDYFYDKIGLNLTDLQTQMAQESSRLVGDQFYQTKIIEEQLRSIRKNKMLLSDNNSNVNTEIQSMLDNAADEYSRLGLSANQSLTQTQIDSLQKDIIWYETETINGGLYIVPKIYLTKATRQKLQDDNSLTTKSNIMAMGDLQLDSDSLTNEGSIIANNITVTTANDITNKNFSEITATNDLKLTSSTGNIINKSKLASKGNITLAAAKDITNNSTINTITSGKNISSILFETASIETINNLKILAGNNFENKAANLTTTQGDIDINVGNSINITSEQLRNKTVYSWGDEDEGGTITNDKITNLQSSLAAKGNINLTSNNNIIIQAANINADNNIDINAANGLYLLTAQNTDFQDINIREVNNWGMTFEQINKGHYNTSIIDNNITAGNGNANINLNGQNKILAQYGNANNNNTKNLTEILNNKKQQNGGNVANDKITLELQTTINKNWDESVSGLTDVGMAVVAVAAVAATIATAGAAGMALAGAAGGTTTVAAVGTTAAVTSLTFTGTMIAAGTMAALSTAAVTAATTSANAIINNKEGNFLKAFEDITKTTVKTTTSKESLKNIGKSFLTGAFTAGVVDGLGTLADLASTAVSGANTATTTANAVSNIANNTNSLSSLLQQTATTIKEATISTLASATTQAVMEGESFTDTLKNQAQDILISSVANMGAKAIGNAAHGSVIQNIDGTLSYKAPTIGKATQLTLHAGLGAGTAALSGNDAVSGAVSGVIGEVVGELALKNGASHAAVKEVAGLAGGLSSIFAGNAIGLDGSEIADNVWSGSRIGKNAAENNALSVWVQEVAAGNYHTSIKIEPEDQEKYADDERFDNTNPDNGKRYATIGGGPGKLEIKTIHKYPGNLTKDLNRIRDVDTSIKVWESKNLVKPELEDSYIENLFEKNKNYQDNLNYDLFPSKNSNNYNSNSYTSGLLNATNIPSPKFPITEHKLIYQDIEYPDSQEIEVKYKLPTFSTPGYEKPVPIENFN